MFRRLFAAALLTSALVVSAPHPGTAQVSGVAFAALRDGDIFANFIGPWRITLTGMDINYSVVCYDTSERRKLGGVVVASIPDGSSLADIRTFATTAVVNFCQSQGLTVPRGAVVLPQVILGQ